MPQLNALGPQMTYAIFVVIHWKAEWWLNYEIVSVPIDCLLHLMNDVIYFILYRSQTIVNIHNNVGSNYKDNSMNHMIITRKKELDCFGYTWTRETDVHIHVHSYFYYYS